MATTTSTVNKAKTQLFKKNGSSGSFANDTAGVVRLWIWPLARMPLGASAELATGALVAVALIVADAVTTLTLAIACAGKTNAAASATQADPLRKPVKPIFFNNFIINPQTL